MNYNGMLKVTFISSVNLRKIIHNLFQAIQLLTKESVEFNIIGLIGMSSQTNKQSCASNVNLIGSVNRLEIHDWLANYHVFLFPTISDG
jgi:glycosyltransferase involved in cell wall biosynthesis